MSDKHKLTLDTQVQQSRRVKALTAENSRLRAENARLREALGRAEACIADVRKYANEGAAQVAVDAYDNGETLDDRCKPGRIVLPPAPATPEATAMGDAKEGEPKFVVHPPDHGGLLATRPSWEEMNTPMGPADGGTWEDWRRRNQPAPSWSDQAARDALADIPLPAPP
jgi:hypothetical protein